jgi:hypothetical protein
VCESPGLRQRGSNTASPALQVFCRPSASCSTITCALMTPNLGERKKRSWFKTLASDRLSNFARRRCHIRSSRSSLMARGLGPSHRPDRQSLRSGTDSSDVQSSFREASLLRGLLLLDVVAWQEAEDLLL